MEAIQTRYRKCLFRSRLEARWAVFFDSLRLPWEYEKEGFKLSDGSWYLPDFWLPTLECFFEVKGQAPTEAERRSAALLSRDARKLVVISSGVMDVEQLKVGERDLGEWPTNGFNIEAFGGDSYATWPALAFDFAIWNYLIDTDLPPFIKQTFPDETLPTGAGEERRKRLIELDEKYYRSKYSRPHPRYQWGRYEQRVVWAMTDEGRPFFSMEPEDIENKLSRAYEVARSARFEFNNRKGVC